MTDPSATRLPDGFTVALAGATRLVDGGAGLLGARSGRYLRLTPGGAGRLEDGRLVVGDAGSARLARLLLDRDLADPWWRDDIAGSSILEDDAALGATTVVVPVRDRPDQLRRLLAALPRDLPVVVVDDGSATGATAAVAVEAGARVVRLEGRGPAAARNAGVAACATPYVALLDSDIVPEPGWLTRLHRHLADPAVGVVAPRVLGLGAPRADGPEGWLHRYEAVRSSLDLGPAPAAVHPGGAVAYVPSAALLVRRAAWGDGFDEAMLVGEDVDLVWRVHGSGWRVRYEPRAVVRHEHRTQLRGWLGRKAFYGTSAALLATRHGDAVAPMVLTPWSAVLTGALLAQRRWSLPVAAAAYGVATWRVSRRLGATDRPLTVAARMTATGAVSAVWQTGSALTRHHWPVAVAAALVSRRARRALVVAAVLDGLADHRRSGTDLDPVRYVAARRLDDLAYGAGAWWGAWRERSPRALLPAVRGLPRRRAHP